MISKSSDIAKVAEAPEYLKSVSQKYHSMPSQAHKIQLIMANKNLDDAYIEVVVEYINSKVQKLENKHTVNSTVWPGAP